MTKRTSFILLAAILLLYVFLYLPVLSKNYVYTDEVVQLWLYKKGNPFNMFIPLGRYITDVIFQYLFESIQYVHEVTGLRLFSLTGWFVCIPVWFFVIRNVLKNEKFSEVLAPFSVIYAISMPSFTITIVWASCMELFIANTCGLIAGYCLYNGVTSRQDRTIYVSNIALIGSVIFGVISLFTYQNGFGCFYIPFLIHFLAARKIDRKVVIGIGMSIFIYLVYYLLFKYNLRANHIEASERSGISINVWNKLRFFIARPLVSSFHFTYLFNEQSIIGQVLSFICLAGFVVFFFIKERTLSFKHRIQHIFIIGVFLGLVYLPSLLVKENYASNRTLFGLKMAVFIIVAMTIFRTITNQRKQYIYSAVFSILFLVNAWYNIHCLYLSPVVEEYNKMKVAIEQQYRPGVDTVYFLRPQDDFFVKKYKITRSWDEFGVPSTFFDWTPPFLVKQVVYEKTKDRERADKLVIISSLNEAELMEKYHIDSAGMIYLNANEILK